MRLLVLASAAAGLLGSAAFAQTLLGQDDPGGAQAPKVISVPEAPKVVAAPPTPVVPNLVKPVQPPPGLVETPLPPVNMVQPASLPKPMPKPMPQAAIAPVPTQAVSPSAPVSAQAVSPSAPAAPPPGVAVPLPANDIAPTPQTKWVYGHVATLNVLNKVDGGTDTLNVPVGGQAVVDGLVVSVQACVARPPEQLPDAAVFMTLTDEGDPNDEPVYHGWVVKSVPGATDAETSDASFQVVGCS